MPSTDLVPCFYTGQRRLVERPAEFRIRIELHDLKKRKLGKFVDSGKVFLFNKRVEQAAMNLWDGPLGVGNLLPFARLHNYGEKLHYEVPRAGDRSCFARHHRRPIHASSRNLFSKQPIPAVRLAV